MLSRISALPLVLLLLTAAGCAGTIEVEYAPRPVDSEVKAPPAVVVAVEPFEDARPGTGPSVSGSRTIGRATAVVFDLPGGRVTLSEDVTTIVERGFATELKSFGYTVAARGERADLVLRGEVRDFALDVAGRDVVAIEVAARLVDPSTGRVVWSGAERLTDDRYAGVMGNTKGTIARYISANLSRVIRTLIAEATPVVAAHRSGPPPPPAPAAAPSAPAAKAPVPEGSGRLVVATDPPKARVYLDGVYFGLTPITIDTDPGIYDLTVRRKGFDDYAERVSLREGQTTEMEVSFER